MLSQYYYITYYLYSALEWLLLVRALYLIYIIIIIIIAPKLQGCRWFAFLVFGGLGTGETLHMSQHKKSPLWIHTLNNCPEFEFIVRYSHALIKTVKTHNARATDWGSYIYQFCNTSYHKDYWRIGHSMYWICMFCILCCSLDVWFPFGDNIFSRNNMSF